MPRYQGRCHCGSIKFSFVAPAIKNGLRCNCSICIKKGAMIGDFIVAPEEMKIEVAENALATYQFATHVGKHHFCKRCGIYPFHQTLRKPGHYRVNLGCVEGVDTLSLPHKLIDGAAL
ncbi:GFA family protein [Neptuniibacter pectenicola]|jgi:hypothetical protein|uniref:GFA family protein n=1 Tax=Neptuniibacter pectenicola TaxID=1806669 RepID=UPI000B077673|nr:GFA family protein [Neptuniibacter pectenicola]